MTNGKPAIFAEQISENGGIGGSGGLPLARANQEPHYPCVSTVN